MLVRNAGKISAGIHSITFQEKALFVATAAGTSNPAF
jgi:hypothetical protein